MLFKPRIDVSQLSDVPPVPPEPNDVNYGTFMPSADEQRTIKQMLSRCVQLSLGKEKCPPHTHEFSAEMKLKTEKVSK